MERANALILAPDDKRPLADDVERQVISRVWNVANVTCALPGFLEEL
jgi:hypothetical protein